MYVYLILHFKNKGIFSNKIFSIVVVMQLEHRGKCTNWFLRNAVKGIICKSANLYITILKFSSFERINVQRRTLNIDISTWVQNVKESIKTVMWLVLISLKIKFVIGFDIRDCIICSLLHKMQIASEEFDDRAIQAVHGS